MRIGGVEVNSPCEEILVLPRPTLPEGQIVFRAQAVVSMDEFDKVCPEPEPPTKIVKGGERQKNYESPNYLKDLENYQQRRLDFICIKSLEPSEIEWSEVDLKRPATWCKWQDELRAAGFANTEINKIFMTILQANALDERKLKEARESFLRGQGATQERSSGPRTGPESTPSGQPANDSE